MINIKNELSRFAESHKFNGNNRTAELLLRARERILFLENRALVSEKLLAHKGRPLFSQARGRAAE